MFEWLNKEIRNQTIMLILGILLFAYVAYVEGIWWAIKSFINIYLAITVFDAIKQWLAKKEQE